MRNLQRSEQVQEMPKILLAIVLGLSLPTEPVRSQDPEQAASLLEALLINNQSLASYDTYFTREVVDFSDTGRLKVRKSKHRLIHDSARNAWLAVIDIQSDDWVPAGRNEVFKRFFGDFSGNHRASC
jgi:hypothetical protein